ncbi:FeoB-associated Cys-rich membrane protein [Pseudodesulfovibrio sp.]|uniref:FeoB-associated Cys-rich membrane protein n=1 Tax=Pseudodesulfovibrio sp. TaxID=2035812 RepID=UPI00260CD952|nr:FeoB-associated Cys-rich membrane protein [Pseudodesulfovibrio sp.]MDD3311820.1 FeoB-associated Cys-rich membrane protein [Pseudodesulfovibrio sp.]
MTDTIIVGIIVLAAFAFFARRVIRTFRADRPSCDCSGCSQGPSCPSQNKAQGPSCGCRQ